MNTLQLSDLNWDLVLDSSGNMATRTNGIAIAQDVASAVRLFFGELWYAADIGVPYFADVLGQAYVPSIVQALVEKAALSVPGVVQAQCNPLTVVGRTFTGNIKVIDTVGESHNVHF
jgi:hypothetical protein